MEFFYEKAIFEKKNSLNRKGRIEKFGNLPCEISPEISYFGHLSFNYANLQFFNLL